MRKLVLFFILIVGSYFVSSQSNDLYAYCEGSVRCGERERTCTDPNDPTTCSYQCVNLDAGGGCWVAAGGCGFHACTGCTVGSCVNPPPAATAVPTRVPNATNTPTRPPNATNTPRPPTPTPTQGSCNYTCSSQGSACGYGVCGSCQVRDQVCTSSVAGCPDYYTCRPNLSCNGCSTTPTIGLPTLSPTPCPAGTCGTTTPPPTPTPTTFVPSNTPTPTPPVCGLNCGDGICCAGVGESSDPSAIHFCPIDCSAGAVGCSALSGSNGQMGSGNLCNYAQVPGSSGTGGAGCQPLEISYEADDFIRLTWACAITWGATNIGSTGNTWNEGVAIVRYDSPGNYTKLASAGNGETHIRFKDPNLGPGSKYFLYPECATWRGIDDSDNGTDSDRRWTVEHPDIASCSRSYTVQCPVPWEPSNLQYSCNAAGDQMTVTWSAGWEADNYDLRLDNLIDGWDGSCSSAGGDRCDNTVATSVTYAVAPGERYNFWVHSKKMCSPNVWVPPAGVFLSNIGCRPPVPPVCTIQVSKKYGANQIPGVAPAPVSSSVISNMDLFINNIFQTKNNSYTIVVPGDTTYTVRSQVPAAGGWSVDNTLCVDGTNCHDPANAPYGVFGSGASRTFTCESGTFVDLWFHYFDTPQPPYVVVSTILSDGTSFNVNRICQVYDIDDDINTNDAQVSSLSACGIGVSSKRFNLDGNLIQGGSLGLLPGQTVLGVTPVPTGGRTVLSQNYHVWDRWNTGRRDVLFVVDPGAVLPPPTAELITPEPRTVGGVAVPPTPTPTPASPIPTPVYIGASCFDSAAAVSNVVRIDWSTPDVQRIEISTNNAFDTAIADVFAKTFPTNPPITNTFTPIGFVSLTDGTTPMTMTANTLYYVRTYNGVGYSPARTFTTALACPPTPTMTPTMTPTPIPNAPIPSINVTTSCLNRQAYSNVATISWTDNGPDVTYVDVSANANFNPFYNRSIGGGQTSTTIANGFGGFSVSPGVTYYVRTWNGYTHSTPVTFSIPQCGAPTSTPTPLPTATPTNPPQSPQPVISSIVPGCLMAPTTLTDTVQIDWTNNQAPVTYVDISPTNTFSTFHWKGVGQGTPNETYGTYAPNGFRSYPGWGTPLTIYPNATYYVRTFNNYNHSSPTAFRIPACPPTWTPAPPTNTPSPTPTPRIVRITGERRDAYLGFPIVADRICMVYDTNTNPNDGRYSICQSNKSTHTFTPDFNFAQQSGYSYIGIYVEGQGNYVSHWASPSSGDFTNNGSYYNGLGTLYFFNYYWHVSDFTGPDHTASMHTI